MLEAAIELGVPYVDVCDDHEYSETTKALHHKAVDAGVPCITSAGIYPGQQLSLQLSSLLQIHSCIRAQKTDGAMLWGTALIWVLHHVQSMDTFHAPSGHIDPGTAELT